ncbi:hypothetical protein PVAND_012167 [Polypedilum vanderplanki]|uniref:CRAL-TRIO domain-containing protein n=1 Tax=Polypedilum vanderplanki TaxID=319348 RepID=A0A9J6CLL5_POLVA|nr:hypothetical protein PVAND_012167 [Polypedilum vanderplanki]
MNDMMVHAKHPVCYDNEVVNDSPEPCRNSFEAERKSIDIANHSRRNSRHTIRQIMLRAKNNNQLSQIDEILPRKCSTPPPPSLPKYQTKSITPVDEYKSNLSDELKKIAEKELRETDKIRTHAIKAMREWAMENKRIIKCRLDSTVILKVLRFRKFSIPMSQEAFERYLLFREGLYGYDFFSNLDPLKPGIISLLENGLIVPIPNRDKYGRKVILIKLSALDPTIPDIGCRALTLLTLIMEVLIEEEENQIRGLSYVADLSGVHLKQALIFPLDVWYKFGKNTEKVCAIRHKAFHIINMPSSMKFLIDFAVKQMPQKLRDRVKFHTLDSIADIGSIDKRNMPVEYGGEASLIQIADEWKSILISQRERFLKFSEMKVNYKMYPKSILECDPETLKTPLSEMDLSKESKHIDIAGVQGSFRKLEID